MGRVQHTFDREIYCPFFKGTERSQAIRCESPVPRTSLRLELLGKNRFMEYLERYCKSKACEKCWIHRMLMLKYEEKT